MDAMTLSPASLASKIRLRTALAIRDLGSEHPLGRIVVVLLLHLQRHTTTSAAIGQQFICSVALAI